MGVKSYTATTTFLGVGSGAGAGMDGTGGSDEETVTPPNSAKKTQNEVENPPDQLIHFNKH